VGSERKRERGDTGTRGHGERKHGRVGSVGSVGRIGGQRDDN